MPGKQKSTIMVLHKAEDLIALEDELTAIAGEIREMRQELSKNQMEGVVLKSGTFRMHLNRVKECVPALKASLEKQKIMLSVQKTRERILDERKNKS